MDIYYKIVRDDLTSYIQNCKAVQYKINEFVYPIVENSKLFVFADLIGARKELLKNRLLKPIIYLYSCEVVNPFYCKEILYPNRLINPWRIEDFYNKNNVTRPLPGTFICDAVKLLEKIM